MVSNVMYAAEPQGTSVVAVSIGSDDFVSSGRANEWEDDDSRITSDLWLCAAWCCTDGDETWGDGSAANAWQ